MILTAVGRGEDALRVYAAALAIAEGEPAILTNRGKTLAQLGRLDEALASHDMALARAPHHVNALYNRGNVLLALKRHAEAVASYDRALAIKPDLGPALSNRGNANQALGLNREALSDYERAHALMPDDNQVGCNLGLALHNLNRDQDALRAYAEVLKRDPAAAAAHYNAAIALLRLGDFKRGWREYEWRWRCAFFQPMVRNLPAPLWLGAEDLAGRRILLHGEQGFGDMIQFLRYVPLAKQRGATVILDVPPELAALAHSLRGVDEFAVPGQPLPGFDMHCPLLSLPHAFGTEIESIPAEIPYLDAPPDRKAKWDERFRAMARPRIGLVWSGRSTHVNDRQRSIAFGNAATAVRRMLGLFCQLADRDTRWRSAGRRRAAAIVVIGRRACRFCRHRRHDRRARSRHHHRHIRCPSRRRAWQAGLDHAAMVGGFPLAS